MPNRLADAYSPYLRQHAGNPVDWWPWGDEAFAEARRRDVPVFLSVGYATCHWCHVMAHESFEDEEAAAALNGAFVCVKVDREERPDVDAVYMAACQAMTGQGGWPLTAILMPEDRRPFFVGTYFPKESRHRRIGLMELIARATTAWTEQREGLYQTADEVARVLARETALAAPGEAPGPEALGRAAARLLARFDGENGGFGRAPKFPTPHNLLLLLRHHARTGDGAALDAVTTTLRAMRRGGIHDHLGGGFHRYSTDARWLLPHFEKMLYDQALLLMAYVEAYQATGQADLRETAENIVAYVLRDLTSPEGPFYSAEDADSLNTHGEMEEGAFYVWTEQELEETLGPEDAAVARVLYGTQPEGNYADEATRALTGGNVLHHAAPLEPLAAELGLDAEGLRAAEERIRARLFAVRADRPPPLLDDKVLTDWNGLMIAALAKASRACGEPTWADAATRAADFLLETMRDAEGGLLHRYWRGTAGVPALLDDYAMLAWGLTELYQTRFDPAHLRAALDLHRTADRLFGDTERGGWYLGPEPEGELPLRPKESYDGAVPSGQAVMTYNAVRFARLTGDAAFDLQADRALEADAEVGAYPDAHTFWMAALSLAVGPSQEVVVADGEGARDMLDRLGQAWAPEAVFLFRSPGMGPAPISELAPFTELQTALEGKATAYVCERQACQAPTTDVETALRLLGG